MPQNGLLPVFEGITNIGYKPTIGGEDTKKVWKPFCLTLTRNLYRGDMTVSLL